MKLRAPCAAVILLLEAGLAQAPRPESAVRFVPVDVYIDAGAELLAAYQVEVTCTSPAARIAGVEGGEGHFAEPPFHDPAALQGGRILLAAFTTEDDPPSGRIRVARLHMEEPAEDGVEYRARIVTAAAPGGRKFEASVETIRMGGER